MNAALILSGGVGARFGAFGPKLTDLWEKNAIAQAFKERKS